VSNSLDVASVIPDHVEVERTLQGRMVGLLAKADPALRTAPLFLTPQTVPCRCSESIFDGSFGVALMRG
jgi:hypothetical protein